MRPTSGRYERLTLSCAAGTEAKCCVRGRATGTAAMEQQHRRSDVRGGLSVDLRLRDLVGATRSLPVNAFSSRQRNQIKLLELADDAHRRVCYDVYRPKRTLNQHVSFHDR